MPTEVVRMTRKEIEKFLSYDEERKKLNRQAADLEKQAKPIKEKMIEFVKQSGGKEKTVTTCGHQLALVTRAGTVQWKPEFIRVAGQRAADELIAAAEPGETLTVEPVAA